MPAKRKRDSAQPQERTKSRLKIILAATVVLISLPFSTQAQQSSSPHQSLKIDVELTLVTATVTDPSGRIVSGLRPENFRLWEDRVEQKIEYFSEEDVPMSLGLIFDISGSMSEKLSKARDAAVTFLKMGSPEDEYFLVEFSDAPKVTEDITTDVSRLQNHLVFAHAKGMTALFDAVYVGLEKLRTGTNTKKALLVITDGEDNHSRYTFSDVKEFARERDVQIFAIGIVDPVSSVLVEGSNGRAVIEDLVAITGGRAFFPESVYELEDICAKIALELKNQYVIGYHPGNTEKNGKWRKIRVKLSPPKGLPSLSVRSKTGYYAPTLDVVP
jgi:Ca-activated chloride channel family protein